MEILLIIGSIILYLVSAYASWKCTQWLHIYRWKYSSPSLFDIFMIFVPYVNTIWALGLLATVSTTERPDKPNFTRKFFKLDELNK